MLVLIGYLTLAILFVVSWGEHVIQHTRNFRRTLLASVGSFSLALGVVFGSLFFSQIAIAQENSAASAKADGPPRRIELGDVTKVEERQSDLPEWVETKAVRTGSKHTTPIVGDFKETESAAIKDLDAKMLLETQRYIDWYLDQEGAYKHVGFSVDEIKRRWLVSKEPTLESREFVFGRMTRAHSLLEFTKDFRTSIDQKWESFVAESRLWQLGLSGGGILLLLVVLFGYFSLDSATRGFYSGRLQFLTAIAILALIGFGIYFARLIEWV